MRNLESIGTLLKKCREQKGLTLKDIENITKIRTKYIEAIEQDNFEVIPGEVYVKGFIRSYADSLGLDGNVLVQHYKELKLHQMHQNQQEDKLDEKNNVQTANNSNYYKERRQKRRKQLKNVKQHRIILFIILLIITLILITPIIWRKVLKNNWQQQFSTNQQEQKNIQKNIGNQDSDLDSNSGNDLIETQSPPSSIQPSVGLLEESSKIKKYLLFNERPVIIISATERPCWYEISLNGKTISSSTIEPEKQVSFDAIELKNTGEELKLVLGDPGAVEITINNYDLGVPGKDGMPITLYFKKE